MLSLTKEHEHQWICLESGENWDPEGKYFDRFEECDVEGCGYGRHVRYHVEQLSTYQSE